MTTMCPHCTKAIPKPSYSVEQAKQLYLQGVDWTLPILAKASKTSPRTVSRYFEEPGDSSSHLRIKRALEDFIDAHIIHE